VLCPGQRESLEVTNCFPFPTTGGDDDGSATTKYQTEMMVRLREVNVDSNTAGWYQSTYLGSHLSPTMVATQFNYQEQVGAYAPVPLDFDAAAN
jgi:translation initiation factor 3 subunit H